ncbi:MAG: hypothetical protein RR441_11540, partial [Longicatena sp.]
DVKVDEQGKSIDIWLEKYEYGQLTSTKRDFIGIEIFEDHQILVKIERIPESNQAIICTAVVNESGGDSSNSTIELPKDVACGWALLVPDATTLTDNMVIGQIIYEEKSKFETGWLELNNDLRVLVKELKDYPVVYLLRAAFKDTDGYGALRRSSFRLD